MLNMYASPFNKHTYFNIKISLLFIIIVFFSTFIENGCSRTMPSYHFTNA